MHSPFRTGLYQGYALLSVYIICFKNRARAKLINVCLRDSDAKSLMVMLWDTSGKPLWDTPSSLKFTKVVVVGVTKLATN